MGGEARLTVTVWPTHVGVQDDLGVEPWRYPDYHRSQIMWDECNGEIVGRTSKPILVPAGEFPYLVFAHHPTTGLVLAVTQLHHPFRFYAPSDIMLHGIVEEDFAEVAA